MAEISDAAYRRAQALNASPNLSASDRAWIRDLAEIAITRASMSPAQVARTEARVAKMAQKYSVNDSPVNDPARVAAGVARATAPRGAASASAGSTGSS